MTNQELLDQDARSWGYGSWEDYEEDCQRRGVDEDRLDDDMQDYDDMKAEEENE